MNRRPEGYESDTIPIEHLYLVAPCSIPHAAAAAALLRDDANDDDVSLIVLVTGPLSELQLISLLSSGRGNVKQEYVASL